MSFLAPLFLLGILAVGVPIALHLSRKRTPKAIAFPSLMFVAKVPYRSVRRRRLRELALLALRCAALVALAIAFARPLLDSAAATPGSERRELVLLVDRSFSMGHGERWQRALEEARDVIATLDGSDAATLVAFDERAEVVVPPTADSGRLLAALSGLATTSRSTRYVPAFKAARTQLLESSAGVRQVVFIGDLQRGELGGALEDAALPPGAELLLRDVTAGEAVPVSNVALTGVTLDRTPGPSRGREQLQVTVRAVAFGGVEQGAAAPSLRLELDGRVVQEQVGSWSDDSTTVTFAPVDFDARVITRGRVLAANDSLPLDDVLAFVVSPADAIPVLLIDDGGRERGLYVERALSTARRPRFTLERRSASEVVPADLARARVVAVLDGISLLQEATRTELTRMVEAGSGLLVSVARRDSGGALSAFGLAGREELEQALSGRSLAFLDYDHPVFEPFVSARSGDFSSARFFRYRRLPDIGGDSARDDDPAIRGGGEGPVTSAAQVLARFDDGAPALVEVRRGGGRVLVWATTLDAEWSDLVLQPVFVPWLDAAFRHLAGYQPPRESYQVGQTARLEVPAESGREWLVVAPSGANQTFETDGELLFEVAEQGFYQVRPVEGGPSTDLTIAANVDPAESDLRQLDAEELAASVTAAGGGTGERSGDGAETPPDASRAWWYVLLAVTLLLVGESLFANRRQGMRAT
ncbi:MAG TPA: BatA domain-containing protein [Thermoanaerobaculia bacterium]|nr:BatA domain-containing protein [Thermoanaerobaculia bacterium]